MKMKMNQPTAVYYCPECRLPTVEVDNKRLAREQTRHRPWCSIGEKINEGRHETGARSFNGLRIPE